MDDRLTWDGRSLAEALHSVDLCGMRIVHYQRFKKDLCTEFGVGVEEDVLGV